MICHDLGSKILRLTAYCFVGHQDLMLSQQILDVAELKHEPKIEPNCVMDDLSREVITEIANFKKFDRNVERDRGNCEAIEAGWWRVLTIWECETSALDGIEKRLRHLFGL